MKNFSSRSLVPLSFLIAIIILFYGGLKEKESISVINLVIAISSSMAGFGLVAFQIARASNELRNDFVETSIVMIMSTISGFFFLLYPEKTLLTFNFGEVSILMFLWAVVQFLIVLVDKRFNLIK